MIGLIIGIYVAIGSIIIIPGDIINSGSHMTTFENAIITSARVVFWPGVVIKGGVEPWNKTDRFDK